MSVYDLKPMKAPRATGRLLRLVTFLFENPVTGPLLTPKLLQDLGITALREATTDEPLPALHPIFTEAPAPVTDARPLWLAPLAQPADNPGFHFETIGNFSDAYQHGRATPEEVALRVLERSRQNERRNPPMRTFIAQDADDILAQAQASTERYRAGRPLSPLDGVPVAVKDEVDQRGYGTTAGTRFLGRERAEHDAASVARLRAAGAILIGKANMHELGMGVTGNNPHHGACRNPYDPGYATGGSSSGSAAAVAAGLCPLALGADGGGSIRIPASYCGVVGLKPTYGRVSEHGASPLCWSVAHIGPIGATVRDVALGYALMAGPDASDPNTSYQPPVSIDGLDDGVRGLRLGVFREWFEDAEPSVVSACKRVLDGLVEAGAEIVEIEIPRLSLLRAVHLVSITSEMAAAQLHAYARQRRDFGYDVRGNLAMVYRLGGYDYVQAQRHRLAIWRTFSELLSRVDAIVTPTTARTAPPLAPDALRDGESNLPVVDQTMRYAHAANLTGLPAISFPAGYDDAGLPIGFQAMGRAWEEQTLLRLARTAERFVSRRAPLIHHSFL